MSTAIINNRQSLVEVRRFYLGLGILLAVLATLGFWPQYFLPLVQGESAANPVIHLHATVFVGWLLLFIVQCFLVASGNIALHRRLGNLGLIYGTGLVIVGLFTTIAVFAGRLEEGGIEAVEHTAIWPIIDMVIFPIFFGAAAYYRKKPELHKRLMLVAASSILIPSTGRFAIAIGLEGPLIHYVSLAMWLSPILLAMVYDFVRYKLVHSVYVIGSAVIAISSYRDPLRFTDTWRGFTHWLASVLA